ncbi:hypothetical protein [Nocardia iowensis]|uniref:Uncharacterized protein n=1 Tax=Nocardia iowensis TaxID=204891 RepID=A0ABX8RSE6_NOCIO|nr:hypothetical protein [Nocardia iowensis]QXN92558.1 hypothetical protein KV110_05260 [Nocardia iowensis]
MPDEYDKIREEFNPPERGRIFENGTEEVFHDQEKGYVSHPAPYTTSFGPRKFDKARADELGKVHALDDKSGQVGSKNDLRELAKDRELLASREIETLTIRTVAGEKVSAAYERGLNELRKEFGARVIQVELTREQARDVFAKGIAREKDARQLELPGVAQQAREQKGVDLQKRREKQVTLAKAREVKGKFQAVQKFSQSAERGRAEAPQRIQAERAQQAQERDERAKTREAPETERERVSREAAEKTVREFQERLKTGPVPSAGKAPEKTTPERGSPEAAKAALVEQVERDAARLAAREFPFPVPARPQERETVEIGERSTPELNQAASVEREAADKARAEREAADKAREAAQERAKALEQAQLQGISPEVKKLLALGQAHPPTAAVETKPGYAPGVERGGTGQGRDPRTPEIGPRTQ